MIPKQPTIHHCCLSSNIPACIQHIRLNTFPFNTQIDNTFPFNTLFREDGVAAHFPTLMPVSELVKPVVVVVVVDVVVDVVDVVGRRCCDQLNTLCLNTCLAVSTFATSAL